MRATKRIKLPAPDREAKIARRRYQMIRRAGYPNRWPDEIAAEQGWRCHYCTRNMTRDATLDGRQRTLDHIVPVSRGGKTQRSNLVACCARCNGEKASQDAGAFAATKVMHP